MMRNNSDRYSKLKKEREKRLQSFTKEQRMQNMQSFLEQLNRFGEENFPFNDYESVEEGDERR